MDLQNIATDFLKLCTTGAVEKAFRNYTGTGFIHHNPFFESDCESLQAAMLHAAKQDPNKDIEFIYVIHDSTEVMVHSKITLGDGNVLAAMHRFRFVDGKVVELWDIVQPQPVPLINKSGMF